MTAPAIPWAQLSAKDEATILSSPALGIETGLDLLDPSLSFIEDLTADLETDNADVEWSPGDGNSVHRDCSLTLTRELAWGTARLRVRRTLTDYVTGLSAWFSMGVFCPQDPTATLDTLVRRAQGDLAIEWPLTGQDRTSLLDGEVGYTYFLPSTDTAGDPVKYVDAMKQVCADAGLPAGTYYIDSTRQDVLPDPGLIFALVPSTSDSSSDTGPNSGLTGTDPDLATTNTATNGDTVTWRTILNELAAQIFYRNVYADTDGIIRLEPYVTPAVRSPLRVAFDVAAPGSLVSPGRQLGRVLYGRANKWVGIWTNMPDDGDGNAQVASPDNGGVYVVENETDGPASYIGRGNVWVTRTLQLTASSAADVVAQTKAIAAYDQRDQSTMTVSVSPFPVGHFDVLQWIDAPVAARGISDRAQVQSARMPLDGGDVELTLQFV